MKTNKIIIGFAQSDKNYGLSKNKKFKEVITSLNNSNIKSIDTAPVYVKSSSYLKKIKNIKNFKIYSKLPQLTGDIKKLEQDVNNKIKGILIENNIKHLYGIFLHDPLMPLQSDRWKIIYNCLLKFKKNKIIKKIGISVYNKNEVDQCLKIFKPDMVQFPLNIFNQEFVQGNYLKKLKKKKCKINSKINISSGSFM